MSQLDEDVRAAKELGYPSYGYYIAAKYDGRVPTAAPRPSDQPPRRKRPRKFTDADAFRLWQQYFTDNEIASAVGVSRAYIQRWRDQLELPSTTKAHVDTKKYRLASMEDGTSIILCKNDSE